MPLSAVLLITVGLTVITALAANYYNPQKMHFGVLRVLNDDTVAPMLWQHPHDNMEIVSIPLSGDPEHEDSMGNKAVIREGEIQARRQGQDISQ